MERLDVLLLEVLLGHEPHVPLLDRRADCLGIVGIVLLSADERLHVLRRHDFYGVSELLELPLPIDAPVDASMPMRHGSSSPRAPSNCSRRTRRTSKGRPLRSTPWS